MINKNTKLYGSFSKKPGNRGCKIFNSAFLYHGIDAIYKSYGVNNIEKAVECARTLNFGGFAVSMPFKKEVISHVDIITKTAQDCESANTIVSKDGKLVAYNTDFLSAKEFVSSAVLKIANQEKTALEYFRNGKQFCLLGDGGYAAAVSEALKSLNIEFQTINRKNWKDLGKVRNSILYNCTPVENIEEQIDKNSFLIDANTKTKTGRMLGLIQASHQYKLYTGLDLPFSNNA